MLRADLIGRLVDGTEMTKGAADFFLSRLSFILQEEIAGGSKVRVTGIGHFFTIDRKSRTVVNPNDPTKRIEVPSMSIVKFSPSKQLKRAARHSRKMVCKPSSPLQSSSSANVTPTG